MTKRVSAEDLCHMDNEEQAEIMLAEGIVEEDEETPKTY